MNNFNLTQQIAVWILPVLFAVTVHEVAHGWIANMLGDKTALMLGRLTLNPFKHIDPIGTVLVPILCLMLGNFVFGWAKPVPVDWRNLRHPRRDMALVAVAGPLSNFLMTLLWAVIAKISAVLVDSGFPIATFFVYMANAGIMINLLLMILNLIPIPPLDGSRVVASFMPQSIARLFDRIEPYGFIILAALIFTHVLSFILSSPLRVMLHFIHWLFGL